MLINVAYGVKIQKAQGITIKEAVGLNDISIGIELTNPGDQPFTQKQMESFNTQTRPKQLLFVERFIY